MQELACCPGCTCDAHGARQAIRAVMPQACSPPFEVGEQSARRTVRLPVGCVDRPGIKDDGCPADAGSAEGQICPLGRDSSNRTGWTVATALRHWVALNSAP
jgi:hypothetical protein